MTPDSPSAIVARMERMPASDYARWVASDIGQRILEDAYRERQRALRDARREARKAGSGT